MQNFGGTSKEYYGIFESGLWRHASILDISSERLCIQVFKTWFVFQRKDCDLKLQVAKQSHKQIIN